MSLVDPYHDRVFRNGRLYGVNYNEMTNQPSYTDISPFSAGRKAGEGIGLEPDVVIYVGKAAQGMPQDEGMDRRIGEGMMNAIGKAVFGADLDGGDARTLEYVPERDGPATPEPIGPYNPDTDKSEVIQLGDGSSYLRELLRFGEGGEPGRLFREEQEKRDEMNRATEYVAGFEMPADISYPRGRRGDNFEGIPNANDPVMREKLRNRRLRNPAGGQELPGFLGTV